MKISNHNAKIMHRLDIICNIVGYLNQVLYYKFFEIAQEEEEAEER